MAERRMFHTAVVGSDAFLDLPVAAQALYFHLGMRADDDGFVNGPRQIARSLGIGQEELQALIDAGFVLWFDGIAVIRHFRVANSLKSDRLQLPRYPHIARRIYLGTERIYGLRKNKGMESLLDCKKKLIEEYGIQGESQKRRKEKKREEKKREEKRIEECEKNRASADAAEAAEGAGAPDDPHAPDGDRELKFMGGKLGKGVVLLSDREQEDLLERMGIDGFDKYVERLAAFILANNANIHNHYATILKWWQEDRGA